MATAKKPARPSRLKMYLGWDGAYVLSLHPLTVHTDAGLKFLSTGVPMSIADLGPEGAVVFRGLRLRKYEAVEVELRIVSKKPKRKAR